MIFYVSTNPIHTQIPLIKLLKKHYKEKILFVFFRDLDFGGFVDKDSNCEINWDIDKLDFDDDFIFINKKTSNNEKVEISLFKPYINPLKVINLFIKYKPKYVINQGWSHYGSILFSYVSKLFNSKLILRNEAYENDKNIFQNLFKEIFLKSYLSLPYKIIPIGTLNKNFYLSRCGNHKLTKQINYCTDLKKNIKIIDKNKLKTSENINKDTIIFCVVARLINRKRVDRVISLMSKLNSDYFLYIIGDGYLKNDLEKYASKVLKNNKYIFTGFLNNKRRDEIIKKSDYLCLISEKEPWGLVVNEGIKYSCGLILSNEVGASFDLLKDRQNGILVNTKDSNWIKNTAKWIDNANLDNTYKVSYQIAKENSVDELFKEIKNICRI